MFTVERNLAEIIVDYALVDKSASQHVVHCKKASYDVYCGRPSKWGNPFPVKDKTAKARCDAIEQYADWLIYDSGLLKDVNELQGKVLGCWCSPKSCHSHVLAYLAGLGCNSIAQLQAEFADELF